MSVFPVDPVLIVDDDEGWLKSLPVLLKRKIGITNVITCSNPEEVMPIIASRAVSIVLLDFTMPRMMGDLVLLKIKAEHPDIPVLLVTASDQIEVAIRCMQRGAFDYFVKANDTDRILSGVMRAIRHHEMLLENRLLNSGFLNETVIRRTDSFAGLWTQSFRMLLIFRYLEAVAGSSMPVLFVGEPGAGKTTLAQALHAAGKKSGSFIQCDVAGLGDSLLGKMRGRNGLLERAAGGTLYLRGIEHIPPVAGEFLADLIEAAGTYDDGKATQWFTGRIVASGSVPIESVPGMKRLLMKLASHSVHVPPLRDRREDIPVLFDCFLDEASRHFGKSRPTAPPELLTLLRAGSIPGNIRELRDMVFDAVSLHTTGTLSLEFFRAKLAGRVREVSSDVPLVQFTGPRLPTLAEVQEILVAEANRRAGGNQGIMADLLGISRTAVNKRLRKNNGETFEED